MSGTATVPGPTTGGSGPPVGGQAPSGSSRRSFTRNLLLATVGVASLVLGVLVLGPPPTGVPLDPTSVAPGGLRGAVELLDELDVTVRISEDPPDGHDARAFLPVDRLDEDQRDAWLDWVRAGGTLVVAEVTSPAHELAAIGTDQPFGRSVRAPACDLLPEVDEVRQGAWEGLEVPSGADSCFPIGDDDGAWLVTRSVGDGQLTALGSAEPFTNAAIDDVDNAVLLATLLGPGPGEELTIIPRPELDGTEDGGLIELIPSGVWRLLALLVLSLVLLVVWQSRRDGIVVTESLPPVLPSAELARSLAGLLQRSGNRSDAAARLRRANRRLAAHTLGADPAADPAVLASLVAERTAVDLPTAELALVDTGVDDDAVLVDVADATRRLRHDILHSPDEASSSSSVH